MTSNGDTSLLSLLPKAKELLVHTGNVNNCNTLRQKGLSNPSAEVQECLRIMLAQRISECTGSNVTHAGLTPAEEHINITLKDALLEVKPNKNTFLYNGVTLDGENGAVEDRGDLKLTLKIFLGIGTTNASTEVEQMVKLILHELGTDYIDSLIIAFVAGAATSAESSEKFYEHVVRPVWTKMEEMVDQKKVESIGVADLEVAELQVLYDRARIKPSFNHYNIASCCTVPPELNLYSKEHGIQLLTHNDPSDFLPKGALNTVLKESVEGITPDEVGRWHVKSVARYTLLIKCRSVITSKGFFIKLVK